MTTADFAIATKVTQLDGNPISDLIGQSTLDVTVLKKESPNSPEKAFVDAHEAEDARCDELSAIEAFISKHGVKKPTQEDFVPKKQYWGGKRSAAKLKDPNKPDRRGRPRTKFVQDLSFVLTKKGSNPSKDMFTRAGRGRATKGDIRETFTVHFTNLSNACEGTHTRKNLLSMAKIRNADDKK